MTQNLPEAQFFKRVTELLEQKIPFYICRVIDAVGSAPRNAGAQMVVFQDGAIAFTLGGGAVEGRIIRQATLSFDRPRAWVAEHHLGDLGMHCGGVMRVLCEPAQTADLPLYRAAARLLVCRVPFIWACRLPTETSAVVAKALIPEEGESLGDAALARAATEALASGSDCALCGEVFAQRVRPPLRLLIFGAGHVGAKLAEVAAATGVFQIEIVDDRKVFADPEKLPFCQGVTLAPPDYRGALPKPDARTFVAVITRCHATDQVVVRALLEGGAPFAYLGMIGSVPKRARLFKLLADAGVSRQLLERVTTPMGLPIGGKQPGEIAVSMLAEIVQRKNELEGTLEGGRAGWLQPQKTRNPL